MRFYMRFYMRFLYEILYEIFIWGLYEDVFVYANLNLGFYIVGSLFKKKLL